MAASTNADLPVIHARGVRLDVPADRHGPLRRRGGTVRSVHGLDVEMRAGEAVWLVGMPGDGAQEAGRLLSLELVPTAGAVELDGRSMATVRGRALAAARRQVVRIGADAVPDLDPKRTPCEIVAAAAAGSSRAIRPEHTSLARRLLEQVGLGDDLLDVRVGSLAEPERRVVGACRLLAPGPKVVVYQPTWPDRSARDHDFVWAALTRLQDEASIALIVVSNALPDHLGQDERALVLCGGQLVEVLGPGDVAQPLHPFTVSLTTRARSPREGSGAAGEAASGAERSHVDQGCPFRSACPWAKARCESEMPRLSRPLGATHEVACHFPEAPPRRQSGGGSSADAERPAGIVVPPGSPEEPTAREFAEG